jgi:hypothetical protein
MVADWPAVLKANAPPTMARIAAAEMILFIKWCFFDQKAKL